MKGFMRNRFCADKERKENMEGNSLGIMYLLSTISVWGALALVLFGVRRFVDVYRATLEDGGAPDEYMEKIAAYVTGKRVDLACVGISLLAPIVILAGAILLLLLVRPVLKLLGGMDASPYNVGKA